MVHGKQRLILFYQAVLRLHENPDHRLLVQLIQRHIDRHTPDKLGDQAVLDKVLGQRLLQQLSHLLLVLVMDIRIETDTLAVQTGRNNLIQSLKGPAADKQNILRVDGNQFLLRMFPAALGRYGSYGSLNNLQQRLLNTLAGHVSRDGDILGLLCDLVDLVDIDNTVLCLFHVIVGSLDQLQQDILHILAHITGLRQSGGVRDGKGHTQHPRQRLSQQRLTGSRRTQHQHVALLQFHIDLRWICHNSFVMIVHCHRENLLCLILSDHIVVQKTLHLLRRQQIDLKIRSAALMLSGAGLLQLLIDNLRADLHALITNVRSVRTCDQFANLLLGFAAKGASDLVVIHFSCHNLFLSFIRIYAQ